MYVFARMLGRDELKMDALFTIRYTQFLVSLYRYYIHSCMTTETTATQRTHILAVSFSHE